MSFDDNWDRIFGSKVSVEENPPWLCTAECGYREDDEVFEETEVDWEPMGDTDVPVTRIFQYCKDCNAECEASS